MPSGNAISMHMTNEKTTFITYYTPQQALALAGEVTQKAKAALSGLGDTALLAALADYLVSRKN